MKYDKSFGKNLKTSEVNIVPEIFLNLKQSPPTEFVQIIVDKIKAIRDVFEIQRRYKIYASSLILAYDSDAVRKYKQGFLKNEELQNFVNIKLVDFAHVHSADGKRDDNFLRGLNNLLGLFTQFLQRVPKWNLWYKELVITDSHVWFLTTPRSGLVRTFSGTLHVH